MIVLIGGEKGGTGKTTITVNLACQAARENADLVVVDTDLQRSASLFFIARDESGIEPHIPCIEKRGKTLGKELRNLSGKYDLVLVDAGGRDSMELRYSLAVADEVYIPIQPAQADLWTLEKMQNLVEEAQAFNEDLAAFVLLNRCSNNPRNLDAQEAREFLNDYPAFSPLRTETKERVVYQRIFRSGQSVQEHAKDNSAIEEMQNLYKEIFYGQE